MSVVKVDGLHPQVRIVESDHIAVTLYHIELFDGETWMPSSGRALPEAPAWRRAEWLSDVLRLAAADAVSAYAGAEVTR